MSEEEIVRKVLAELVKVKCHKCGKVWVSSLSTPNFYCLCCGEQLSSSKHAVVESENDIN